MKEQVEQAKIWLEEAKELGKAGKYNEAVNLLEKSASIFEESKEWELYVIALNECAYYLCRLSRYDKGLEKAELALSISLKFMGEMNLSTAKSYTNFARYYMRKSEYDKAIDFHNKALEIRLVAKNEIDVSESFNGLGLCYLYKADYEKAINFCNKALIIRTNLLGENHFLIVDIYNNLGILYYCQTDYDKSIDFYNKALKIRVKSLGEAHVDVASTYNNLGLCYSLQMEYNKALEFHNKALKITINTLGENHRLTANCYQGLGVCYAYKKQYNKAITFHRKALNIRINLLGEKHLYVAHSYTNIAYCYHEQKEYDEAIELNYKALRVRKEILRERHPEIAHDYVNIGNNYLRKLSYSKAIDFFSKAFNIYIDLLGKKCYFTIVALKNLSNCYAQKKDYVSSLKYAQEALQSNISDYTCINNYHNPKLQNYLSGDTLLLTLLTKARTFYQYHHSQNELINLQASFFTYQVASLWLNYIRKSLFNEGSKLTLAQNASHIFNNGIKVALNAAQISQEQRKEWEKATNKIAKVNHDSYPKETFFYCYTPKDCLYTAFQFSEQSKAILLLSKFNEQKAKEAANISQELKDREDNLKVQLNFIDKQINQEHYKTKEERDEQKILDLKSKQFDYKQAYEELIKEYEEKYPEYYQAKHDTTIVTVPQIQQKLSSDNALISYFIGEEEITIFAISTTDYQAVAVPEPDNWEQLFSDFMEAMEDAEREEFIQLGHQLYELLIQPIFAVIKDKEELIIIPDGILSQLPFEALCTQNIDSKTKDNNIPYLIMDYDMSYHYSATLWHRGHAPKKQGIQITDSFIGFAPVHKDEVESTKFAEATVPRGKRRRWNKRHTRSVQVNGEAYQELIYSEKEVKDIQKAFLAKGHKAEVQLHQEASVQNFKQQVGQFKYVLVAAHGDYLSDKPELSGIVFSPARKHEVKELSETEKLEAQIGIEVGKTKDTVLYMADAYELPLNADLVVLSCCETSIGQQHKGEGMMGINRAFLYAGAKNVVSTLFKVYDEPSCTLTKSLFDYILAGKSYKKALRQAKIDMIQQEEFDPYCWAGYIIVGE